MTESLKLYLNVIQSQRHRSADTSTQANHCAAMHPIALHTIGHYHPPGLHGIDHYQSSGLHAIDHYHPLEIKCSSQCLCIVLLTLGELAACSLPMPAEHGALATKAMTEEQNDNVQQACKCKMEGIFMLEHVKSMIWCAKYGQQDKMS